MDAKLKNQFVGQIDRAVEDLIKFAPDKIILYGSQARGDFGVDSDIDLLLIKSGLEKKRMIDRLREASRYLEFGAPVELAIFTPSEIKTRLKQNDYFLQDALKEGEVVYEKK